MARENYAAQQARIEKEITKLRRRAEALQMKRRKPVLASIVRSMREYDISPDEIVAALGRGRRPSAAAPAASRKPSGNQTGTARRVVAPKYRHPKTGETWSGRGKAPRWLTAAEAEGAKRETFLIQ